MAAPAASEDHLSESISLTEGSFHSLPTAYASMSDASSAFDDESNCYLPTSFYTISESPPPKDMLGECVGLGRSIGGFRVIISSFDESVSLEKLHRNRLGVYCKKFKKTRKQRSSLDLSDSLSPGEDLEQLSSDTDGWFMTIRKMVSESDLLAFYQSARRTRKFSKKFKTRSARVGQPLPPKSQFPPAWIMRVDSDCSWESESESSTTSKKRASEDSLEENIRPTKKQILPTPTQGVNAD
ncbi:OLC1v1000808C1 [Oldenlandia corymbosa var. corymbosa]|uniref:OLC1v1000808C1 n=1 Tax=Oldenlandia corymbosa var. corymbosa TaxID=529605 RepID=A0AAV1D4U0_OLDCO|nr:OLC1v1000808C1 [Oldenlandia corymbosa var. corymbosa]